jgi:hypothetical protein
MAMVRRRKISQYKKAPPALQNGARNSLIELLKIFSLL